MANELLTNIKFQLKDTTTSPNTYNTVENAYGGVTVGETAPLSRVTNFEDTSERYIAGLSDGDEFSVSCYETHSSPSYQQQFIALKGLTRTVRVVATDLSVSPNTTRSYEFDAVFLGWSLQPALGEASTIQFNFKISGDIIRA